MQSSYRSLVDELANGWRLIYRRRINEAKPAGRAGDSRGVALGSSEWPWRQDDKAPCLFPLAFPWEEVVGL